MSEKDPELFIVHATGKKSRPVTRQQITDKCTAGRMAPDATVAAVGSTLHKPILVFLGESEPTATSETATVAITPKSRRNWLSKTITALMFVMLAGNTCAIYLIHRTFTSNQIALAKQVNKLTDGLNEIARIQKNQAAVPVQRPVPAEMPEIPQTDVAEIISTVNDYQQLLQELTNEGKGGRDSTGRSTDETIARLLGRLQNNVGDSDNSRNSAEQ